MLPGAFPVEMYADGDLVSQLGKLGLTMNDVDAVIQSHLHFDHAGCLEFVGDTEVYVQAAELTAARNPPVYQRDLYNPKDFDHDLRWTTLNGIVMSSVTENFRSFRPRAIRPATSRSTWSSMAASHSSLWATRLTVSPRCASDGSRQLFGAPTKWSRAGNGSRRSSAIRVLS